MSSFAMNTGLAKIVKAFVSSRDILNRLKVFLTLPSTPNTLVLFIIGYASSFLQSHLRHLGQFALRLMYARAYFHFRDASHRWLMCFFRMQPAYRRSSRFVKVRAGSALVDNEVQIPEASLSQKEDVEAARESRKEMAGSASNGSAPGPLSGHLQETTVGVHFLPASGERLHFTFEGTHFWATFTERSSDEDRYFRDGPFHLDYFSRNSDPLRRLIKQARDLYQSQKQGKSQSYNLDIFNDWESGKLVTKRCVDSLHLPGTLKEDLIKDATQFLSLATEQYFAERSIPYRRGYLFHGPPGSGKSSLCRVLSTALQLPVYKINLSGDRLCDIIFAKRMSEIPARSIILMEDIDAAFVKRGDGADKQVLKTKKSISFSALLNTIDGIGAPEGSLLCITTNHIDQLDEALIRPGRIDVKVAFTHATRQQAKDIFLRFFRNREWEDGEDVQAGEDVKRKAEAFARKVTPDTVSVSHLQGFLLARMNDPQKALDDIEDWIANPNRQ